MILISALLLQAVPAVVDTTVRISTRPARPLIEYGAGTNYLNFDFVLENAGANAREIKRITLSVLDAQGRLVHRQFMSAGGAAEPAMLTIAKRVVPANGSVAVFNPFYALPSHLPLDRLRVEFAFDTSGITPVRLAAIDVSPVARRPFTRLTLPLDDPALVYERLEALRHYIRQRANAGLSRKPAQVP